MADNVRLRVLPSIPPASPDEIQMRNNGAFIQWKLESDAVWIDLIALADLEGADGVSGIDGTLWFSDSTTPSDGVGSNGDYFLNSSNGDVYIKAGGSWGAPELNIQGDSINYQGAWVTSTAYVNGDTATNNGELFMCKLAHTSSASDEPGVGGSFGTYWDLAAARGADGADGAAGADGADGLDGALTGVQTETSVDYAVGVSDRGAIIILTGGTGRAFNFAAAATLGVDFVVLAKNEGTATLTINPNGAETIDGEASLTLRPDQSAMIFSDGTNLRTGYVSTLDAVTEILTTVITTDTTHNFNARRVRHEVEMVGGGGAGGGRTSTSNNHANVGAGGSAGFYKKFIVSDAGLTSATITIGAAGVGANGAVGTAGGATTYDDGIHDVSCGGGPGGGRIGGGNTPYIVAPAIATETSTSFTAQEIVNLAARGEGGYGFGNTALGGADYVFSHGGAGASTPLGAGGQARVYASNLANGADGYNASGYGSGGGGCVLSRSASGTRRGGHGAPGIVIIREYLSAV